MTKSLFTLILFLVAGTSFSQIVIKGVVKDIQSKEPLGYATISTEDQQYNTVSNSEGAFVFSCPESTKNIVINYLGYATKKISTSALPSNNIYLMDIEAFILDEVVVMNTPINQFMDKLINNSISHLTAPIVLSTYYREFVKINDKYTKFADGLIDYNLTKKDNSVKTELIVKQSRAAELNIFQEGMVRGIGADVRKEVSDDSRFHSLKEIFPDKKAYKDYSYTIKSKKSEDGTLLQTITFTPLDKVKKALYEVTVTYNPESNLIMNVNARMAASHTQYKKTHNILLARYNYNDLTYNTSFKVINGQYMLSYGYMFGTIHIWNKNYDNTYKFTSDVIVTNFTTDIANFDKTEKYKERSLYENGNHYTEKFWLKNNSIVLTNEEEQVIKSLQNK